MRRFVFACLIAACAAMAPTWASAGDQEIAQHIVQQLSEAKQQGQLKGFDLDLHVDDGTVWLKGFVATEEQKQLVIDAARNGQSLGVKQIVDDIQVRVAEQAPVVVAATTIDQRASDGSSRRPAPATTAVQDQQIQVAQHQAPISSRVPVQAVQRPSAPRASTPLPAMPVGHLQGGAMMQGGAPAYMPAGNSRPAGAYYDQPNVPAYAWPSYAAAPNYSAVTYPTQYSPTAWPYIGPFYPYPQVPLGWRKVTLEWDDGWWYLDFHDR